MKTNGTVESNNTIESPVLDRALGIPKTIGFETRKINVEDPNLAAYGEIAISVQGTSPLLHECPDEKMKLMLQKQTGELSANAKKQAKDVEKEFLESLIMYGCDRPKSVKEAQSKKVTYGVPAIWWKKVAVAMGGMSDFYKTELKLSLFVPATNGANVQLVRHSPPIIRTDRVRNSGVGKTADVRIRAEFLEWGCDFVIGFNSRIVTADQVVSFLIHGGVACGVGGWRPQRDGTHGCFKVISAAAKVPKLQ